MLEIFFKKYFGLFNSYVLDLGPIAELSTPLSGPMNVWNCDCTTMGLFPRGPRPPEIKERLDIFGDLFKTGPPTPGSTTTI